MEKNKFVHDSDVDARAEAFANRAVENLKNGKIKMYISPNSGVPFSVERDAELLEGHKNLINSDMWKEFVTELQ